MAQQKPFNLVANLNKSFKGSDLLGIGFVVTPEEAQALLHRDPRNSDVLFPFLNAEDLNTDPSQLPSRWVINFFEWSLEKAETYPDCIKIIREKVKPQRETGSKFARKEWWLHHRNRAGLYTAIANMKRVLVIPRHSKYMICAWEPVGIIYSDATSIIVTESASGLAPIQCTFHGDWARVNGSTLETRMRYTPTDCFETFPFPLDLQGLENIGKRYNEHRQSIMLAHQEGLTKTYNRFHNPQELAADIVKLRELHKEMDEAVAAAYGWQDLDLEHGFHETKQGLRYTICEEARREVLDRLLRLNHERYAEEVAQGLHEKRAKGAKGGKKKVEVGQDAGKSRQKARKSDDVQQGPTLFDLDGVG